MSNYNKDLDYLIVDVDISKAELEEIITKADKIISSADSNENQRVEAYLKKVQCLQKLNKDPESEDVVRELLKLRPHMPEAQVRLGKLHLLKNEYKEAMSCFDEALESKKYAYAYYLKSWTYCEENRLDKALGYVRIAADLKPEWGPIFTWWKSLLNKLATDDKVTIADFDEQSAVDEYNERFLYVAYERLHSVISASLKSPNFGGAVDNFLSKVGDSIVIHAEYYLLTAIVEFLNKEAPPDERNLFMVAEILEAGVKEDGQKDHKSDMDRLFDILKEKNANHRAIWYYNKFLYTADKMMNDVIYSCRKRFAAIGRPKNIFKYINNDVDIKILARIICKTFSHDKYNPNELYDYLKESHGRFCGRKTPVMFTDLEDGKFDGLDKFKCFCRGCLDDSDEPFAALAKYTSAKPYIAGFSEEEKAFAVDEEEFFYKVTAECRREKLADYIDIFCQSKDIISRLQVDYDKEMPVSYYTKKDISEKILFDQSSLSMAQSYFHLNSINTSNDPEEGKTLFRYLFPQEDISPRVEGYGAFAGCFTFDADSLNQFRLYGKTDDKEGTGVSISLNKNFFSKELLFPIYNSDVKLITANLPTPTSLFRCVYMDTEADKISLGQKEKSVFLRDGRSVKDYNEYKKQIDVTQEYISRGLKILKEIITTRKLDPFVVYKLLLRLRYLVKHAAFREEQECRLIQFAEFNNNKRIDTDVNGRLFITYVKATPSNTIKICFGPKATGIDKFRQQLALHGYGEIRCSQSKAPLA
ncbi:MAG: DUF2971 domain-containing protein [Acidobacteriaceae bacterium]|nr:DUF2971 domain-containing protein [Acidobacteriaceae bacterium]